MALILLVTCSSTVACWLDRWISWYRSIASPLDFTRPTLERFYLPALQLLWVPNECSLEAGNDVVFKFLWIKGWIITWIRSLGRFLSGVLNPDEVFSKSNAIVAISEIQRRCSKRSEILTVSALKHLEHVCRHSSLAPPRQSCVCHSLCQPGNKSDLLFHQKRQLILKTLKMLYLSVTLSNMV